MSFRHGRRYPDVDGLLRRRRDPDRLLPALLLAGVAGGLLTLVILRVVGWLS